MLVFLRMPELPRRSKSQTRRLLCVLFLRFSPLRVGQQFALRHVLGVLESVQMPANFFDPTPEQHHIVLVRAHIVRKAEWRIESCEKCNPEGAELPFDNILDQVTGSDPSRTDYLLERPAKCPNCRRDILEKTLVEAA